MSICEHVDMYSGKIMRIDYWDDTKREVVQSHGVSYEHCRSLLRGRSGVGFDKLPTDYEERGMIYFIRNNNPEDIIIRTGVYNAIDYHYLRLRMADELLEAWDEEEE